MASFDVPIDWFLENRCRENDPPPDDTDPTPPNGPLQDDPPPNTKPSYCNDLREGHAACPDGTEFTVVVPPGTFCAYSKELANQQAQSYADKKAQENRICGSDYGGGGTCLIFCKDEEMSHQINLSSNSGRELFTAVTAGELPNGLTMDEKGLITGTPTDIGQSVAVVTITDTENFTKTIDLCIQVMGFTTPHDLPGVSSCVEFSVQLHAAGGVPPYTFHTAGLPAWLQMSTAGHLHGTPDATEVGDYVIAVSVTDSTNHECAAEFAFTITPVTLSVSAPLGNGVVNQPYTGQATASGGGGTYSYGIDGVLPTGITLNSSTGAFGGQPDIASVGSHTFNVTATDQCGNYGSTPVTIEIGVIGSDEISSIKCPSNVAVSIAIVPPIEKYRYVAGSGTSVNRGILNAQAMADAIAQANAAGWPGCGCYFTSVTITSDVDQTQGVSCPINLNGYGSDANGNMAGPVAGNFANPTFIGGEDMHSLYQGSYLEASTTTFYFVPAGAPGILANVVLIYYHKGH